MTNPPNQPPDNNLLPPNYNQFPPPPYGYYPPPGYYPPYGPPPGYYPYYPPPYAYNPYVPGVVAGFGRRFLAYLIDYILIFIPAIMITVSIFYLSTTINNCSLFDFGSRGCFRNSNYNLTLNLLTLPSWVIGWGLWAGYAALCYRFFNSNTLGKKIMGIKLIKNDGTKPTLKAFLLYFTLGYFVNGLCLLGWLWPLWDQLKQTWAQKLFNFYTVYGDWNPLPPPPNPDTIGRS